MKIGDMVRVICGDNKGTEAKIVKIDRKKGLACLEGIGVIERHMKRTQYNPNGGKKTIHVGIDLSNLKLIKSGENAKAGKATKATAKKAEKKTKKGAK